ncbi:MAG: hypothetical protein DCO96_09220 [Fluviicola sp. XM-24bin1]|nr:MAG: hypothetical protein DCO96_09220 [Fluviicola sp. XM-24bin1]
MRKISLIFALLFICNFAAQAQSPRKVQVAILFDTSNSMDGLIDQAKSRIWKIVNEVSSLKHNGQTPDIEFALYQYGNDGLSSEDNYIQKVLDLTSDLDVISQKLFGLTTNGGQEYCGAVIGQSLGELSWSSSPNDLKMIYIAGNEPFNQGPVDFRAECKKAVGRNIYINTIYCGDYDQGVRELWKEGAECSEGDYFNINSNEAVVHIDTPYDEEIQAYNDSLNTTYYGYGSFGSARKSSQAIEDSNAEMEAPAVATERAIVKSKAVYNNSSWDLLDGVESGSVDLEKMKEEELPEEFKGKTPEERQALLEEKRAERQRYQDKIAELALLRQQFIDDELAKRAEEGEVDDFGTSVNKSLMEKAVEIGYDKETPDVE